MQINVSIDIAEAVQQALNDAGTNACARPLPHNLAANLPITLVEPVGGGTRTAKVLDRFPVRLTTWAETPAEAVEVASLAMARLCAFEGRELGGVQCYRVTPISSIYEPEDPAHPDIPRAIQTAHLWVRTITIDD